MKSYSLFVLPKLFLFLTMLMAQANPSVARQGKFIHAAFTGTKWEPSSMMGGGMESREIILYFRPDGTYCTTLGNGWQTETDGHYTIANGVITLIDLKKEKETIPYDGSGSFWYGGTSVFQKKPANAIPPGYYSFSYSSGSGGIGSGTNAPYVGNRAHKGIQFYPDGSFSTHASSGTYISGKNVSGYGNDKKESDGNYTIKDGVLTLHFNNGEKSVNSCFTSDATSSIVVNGTVYNAEEKNENKEPAKPSTSPELLRTGTAFLKKANLANGGRSLDDIKTVKLISSLGNGTMQITTLLDLPKQKIRCEYRKQGQLIGIEQTEGNTGWEWTNGKLSQLPAGRVRELQFANLFGVFGLQQTALGKTSVLSSPATKDQQTQLLVTVDGNNMAWAFDKENRLTGHSGKTANSTITHLFSDFQKIGQVVLPYTVTEMRDNKTFTYRFSSIVLDPSYTVTDWAKP
ncbi:MAG: hypothetical protein J7578_17145 [Chitinophagaceae bacterium]|nr:hypothetical protein [Chitinophagaceae bacterium]